MSFPYIFTFYSYKGGVGRSLALLNVAYTLAGRGRHVLMVDVDLEAPGISGFLHRTRELAAPAVAHPQDILSLLGEAIAVLRSGGEIPQMAWNLPPVSNYTRAVAEDKLSTLRPRVGQVGHLDVLGTDLERDYPERLAGLGLKDLPQDQLIALSRLLHFYFRAQVFPHRPLGIEAFEAPLPTPYDYVLVDSRTGLSEIGGLCVGPLADRLVVITGLNDQNVWGTLRFLDEAGIRPAPRSAADGPWDEADTVVEDGGDNPSLGPKPTIVVASPVPTGEITYKRERLQELERRLGIHPISLTYHPQMALMERVFVRDYPEEYLAAEYEKLATRIMAQVSDDPPRLARSSQALWDKEKRLAAAISCAMRLAPHDPDLGAVLLGHLGNVAKPSDAEQSAAVRQLYALLSQYPEARPAALNNWGNALFDQAKTKAGEEADRLFEEAGRKFAEVPQLTPDAHDALYNWGVALSEQAKTKAGEEADRLCEEAGRKFAEALRLKPDFHEALYNWGVVLSDQAKTKAGEEADRLFEEAGRKYAEALRLKPDYHAALNNWGAALAGQAKTKAGEEAGRLFEEADRKFAEALRLKPDLHEALNNWGAALAGQAKTKAGEEAGERLREAREKLMAAERIRAGAGAFNLACLEALQGNLSEVVRWLKICHSSGEWLSRARIAAEKDLDGVRDEPEFVTFVDSLPEH